MKDFFINNIEVISVLVGVVLLTLMLNIFTLVQDTKFEVVHKWYFLLIIIVGVISSSEAIGKWIVK